jgi:hypothetical protein
MLVKLTNVKVLDDKMKRQILGGADCSDQCLDDCNSDEQIRTTLNGDAEGKKPSILPPTP